LRFGEIQISPEYMIYCLKALSLGLSLGSCLGLEIQKLIKVLVFVSWGR